MATNLIAEIAREFISDAGTATDIISFVEAPWGLGIKLLPTQRFVLKAFYGMPLDGGERNIEVPDMTNEHILYKFNEKEFLKWLHEEGRCNTDNVEGRTFQELVFVAGRRATKCRDKDDLIATTIGSITFGELRDRLGVGEKIGIGTYDPATLRYSVSYDAKAEYNNDVECFEVETKRGIREISSWNHLYLIWRDEWDNPKFVEMRELRPGDRLATSACTRLFGNSRIGVAKASLLGHFQGDGGTTHYAGYTTASKTMFGDICRLIGSEFPGYVVKKKGNDSWRYGYAVVKVSGKHKQNGSRKNDVIEWLKSVGCFGAKSVDKKIPDCILKGDRDEVSAFLSRLFGCDGHASVRKKVDDGHGGVPNSHIGYCSASRDMVDGVRHLLLKYGIYGSVGKVKSKCNGKIFDAWTLRIVRKDSLEKFRDEIGIFSKEDDVDRVVEAAQLRGKSKAELDCIPKGIWGYIDTMMGERGLSCSDVTGEHGHDTPSRLRRNYAPSRWKVASYGTRVFDRFLKDMGTSDVQWDEVESLRPVGKRVTVDIEVPGTHIIGGDLISHNSTLSACISNYELYKLLKYGDPCKHFGFPSNTPIYILNVAPTDDQAGIVFDMIHGMAMQCPYMKDRALHSTMTYFDLKTDADAKLYGRPKASLTSMAGGCSSNSLRGRNAIVVIMDEMAHFIDNEGRFSGSEVYKALTPSIASFGRGGKVICISSPYAKFGSFYDRFNQSFQETDITLMFKMYSAMCNPTIPPEILRAAKRRDRVGFMCEYGGEFSDSITAWIEDESEFRRCIVIPSAPQRGMPDVAYYMGIDLGFKNDGSAVSIVHKDKRTNKIILDYANVWFSGSSDVWEFSDGLYRRCNKYAARELLSMADIVAEIKELSRWFPIKCGIFDQHNGYALSEVLKKEGLKQFEMEQFSDTMNSDVYQLTKMLYAEQLIQVFDHPVLVPEILTLEAEKRAKNKIIVRAPARRGAHDDICDAFVRAVYSCYTHQSDRPYNIATGAGGTIGSVSKISLFGSEPTETLASFHLKRQKMHGDNPRSALLSQKRTLGGGPRIPAMMMRRIMG